MRSLEGWISVRKRLVLVLLAVMTMAVGLVLRATPAAADVTSAGGSAFGVSVTPPGQTISLDPQPSASFSSPPSGATSQASQLVAEAPATGTPPGGFIKAQGLFVRASQIGALGTHTGGSESTVDVERAAYRVDELVADQVHSECRATGDGSSGKTTIDSVTFYDPATSTLETFTDYEPPPNSAFTLSAGLGTVTFNEQSNTSGGQTTGIVVNAMHIKAGAVDVIVGQSSCTATGPDVVVTLPGPHTTLTVSASPGSGPLPLTVVYTYTEKNDGTHPFAGITVVDDTCSPVRFVAGDANGNRRLDPGETWTFTCTRTFASPGSYPSVVRAIGIDTVTGGSHLEQTGTTVEVSPRAICDLEIVKTMSPTPLVSGEEATITVTVTNRGAAPCAGPAAWTDDLRGFGSPGRVVSTDAGWSCPSDRFASQIGCTRGRTGPIAPGATGTFTVPVRVGPFAGTSLTNCASVRTTNDGRGDNNTSCVTLPVVPPGDFCDLEIVKTMSPTPLVAGQTATITVTVTNRGAAPCTGITVWSDDLKGFFSPGRVVSTDAGWSCSQETIPSQIRCTRARQSPTVPPGATATFTFPARVGAPAATSLTNCASVFNSGDGRGDNNTSCVTLPVI